MHAVRRCQHPLFVSLWSGLAYVVEMINWRIIQRKTGATVAVWYHLGPLGLRTSVHGGRWLVKTQLAFLASHSAIQVRNS